jgi:NAD(P)-dependent dehydrogenase (short-subunit alcohol dehydrogenase family)
MKKTVLITGSSSGIGKETALCFSRKDWNVVATMRNPDKKIGALHDNERIECFHLDVLDETSIRHAIQHTLKKYGQLDVLVNNAGYSLFGPFEALTKKQVIRQMDTNVIGLMDVTREVLPIFRKQHHGIIINVSSAAGRMTFPFYSLYNSTKWAVEGFSESLHYELRPFNIRIKIIEPGIINTAFYGRSKDVAKNKMLAPYNPTLKRMHHYEQNIIDRQKYSHPRVVAATIYKAATDNSWKMRYSTGKYARTILTFRKLFPDSLFFGIIRRLTLK